MFQTKIGKIPVYKFGIFNKYSEITVVVTTRIGGVSKDEYSSFNLGLHVGEDETITLANRKLLAKSLGIPLEEFTLPQQTHSDHIEVVKKERVGSGSRSWSSGIETTDGLVTNLAKSPLAVLTADCAGVVLYDPINGVVGSVHAGRKGVESEIVLKAIAIMRDHFGSCPANMIVGIGPCIHKCCYEIDIPGELESQLLSAGLKGDNIEISDICTSCHSDILYSYRADNKKTGRFANIIMINK